VPNKTRLFKGYLAKDFPSGFMSLFLAAGASLSWSLPSITEQRPHRLP